MALNPFGKPSDEPESPLEDDTKKVEVKEEVKEEVVLTPKQQLLKEYGGLESDVPINSPYWQME